MKLIAYEKMRAQVAECARIDEAATFKKQAEALRAYHYQRDDKQLAQWFEDIKVRAIDRLGELSAALTKTKPGPKYTRNGKPVSEGKRAALKAAGVSPREAEEAESVHAHLRKQPPNTKPLRLKDIRQVIKADRRASREAELAEKTRTVSRKLGAKLYDVIYADPPWRFEPYSRDTGMDRAADNHYPTMTLEALRAIKLPAAPNCTLFLWATVPMLPAALDLMAQWGFTYRSACAWVKDTPGTGYWFRNRLELLFVGTRGNVPAPAPGEQYDQVLTLKRGPHSEKPAGFAEMIEDMFPSAALLEMFARKPRLGWDVWGNELAAPREPD